MNRVLQSIGWWLFGRCHRCGDVIGYISGVKFCPTCDGPNGALVVSEFFTQWGGKEIEWASLRS